MNQQCKVCGEPAAGFHFGAFTCEGCKSFFGRSYNNLSSISECKNEGKCVINKKNRTSCKACRLRKCLLVGMSKSGSRYGRRSNWFKIHCLLQEQQQAAAAAAAATHRQQSKTPPPSMNMLGHHPQLDPRLHHQLAAAMSHQAAFQHQGRKEDTGGNLLLHLGGLDEYKNSTSPSISSPESHNSDSSVEVSDARLGSRGNAGIFGKSSGLADLHPMGPPPNGLKDNLFVPLPFASLASLAPTMFPPSSAFLSPSAAAAAAAAAAFNGSNGGAVSHLNTFHFPPSYLYQQHLKTSNSSMHKSPLTVNNNNRHTQNNNDSNNGGDVYSKRFFLDAILQSQRSPSRSPRFKEEDEEEDEELREHEENTMTSKRTSEQQHIPVSRKKPFMPCLSSPGVQEELQENPMDLSMKTCRIRQSSEEERRSSPYSSSGDQEIGTEQDEEAEEVEDNEMDEGDTDYDRAVEADEEDDDEMMSNAHNHHQIHIARSTPMDLTTKA